MARKGKLPRFLSLPEAEALFKSSRDNPRDNLMLKCMFYLGLRNSELESLRIEDVDLINGNVKVVQGKGKRDRYVPIPSSLAYEIRSYIGEQKTGKMFYLSDRHIRRIVKNYAIKAGIRNPEEVHPHTLRHSYATFLQNEGVPLNIIQELLGHSEIDTTTIYIHLGTKKKKEWVEKAFGGQKNASLQAYLPSKNE
ncbi:MAG: tyrosine-type recombinase/integrase [Candidatus Aenigmarchaeota archaeon]|nr:tyrosine-type recombinase/integrase [Candidatus Aenigmarchaeota archaeon]MCK4531383.1 tyrosine-type recombinase/integrase [Candidatus Aenigmarchaeota archaeon]